MKQNVKVLRSALKTIAANGLSRSETVELFDVGNKEYLTYFEQEVLCDFVSNGGSTCRFYEGAYGSGKTHLLQFINGLAIKRGMVVAHIDLAQATSLEDWHFITKLIFETMEADIAGEHVRSLPEILAALGRQNMLDLEALRTASLPHAGFRNAMAYATYISDTNKATWYKLKDFLLGNKVGVTEFRKMGLLGIKSPLTNRNAELVLKTVLGGLYHLGFSGTILLFDENEKSLVSNRARPTKKMKIGANIIRRLIDGCTNGNLMGTLVIFAVLPGFLENCAMAYPALGQRLQMVRGLNKPAWRWAVMPLELVNSIRNPEDFIDQMIIRMERLVKDLGGNFDVFHQKARMAGQDVLDRNVGSGYKSELMKVLAGCLEVEIPLELMEIERSGLESNRASTYPYERKLANANREALEALRFGLVPRSCIEDLTMGFEPLKEWVLGCFPEINQRPMRVSEVSGPFGTGKSHTMTVIRHLANKNGYLTANVEVDGQTISLADPAKLLNALWKTLSGEGFQSATPLLDLYVKFIDLGNTIPEELPDKIKDNLMAIRYLKLEGQLDRFSDYIEGLLSNSEEYTASFVNTSIEKEIRDFRHQRFVFRPLIGIKLDERADDFVQAIVSTALLSRFLGFKGLVITIDEFEVEYNLDRNRRDRVSELLMVLTSYFAGRGQYSNAPLALFLASVGQEGNVGDNLIKYMINKTNGSLYNLIPWSNQQLIVLAEKIHKLYCQSYSLNSPFNVNLAYATEKILQEKGFNDSGLIRAFIKTYVGLLDLKYGPPQA